MLQQAAEKSERYLQSRRQLENWSSNSDECAGSGLAVVVVEKFSFRIRRGNAFSAACWSAGEKRSIHRRGPWRSFEAVEYATLEWVDWSNNHRLLEPIGNIPPAEAEASF